MYVPSYRESCYRLYTFPAFSFPLLHLPFNMNHKRWRKSIILHQAPTIFNFVINRANERRSLCLLPFIFLTWAVPGQRGNRRAEENRAYIVKEDCNQFSRQSETFLRKKQSSLNNPASFVRFSFFNRLIFCSPNTRIS